MTGMTSGEGIGLTMNTRGSFFSSAFCLLRLVCRRLLAVVCTGAFLLPRIDDLKFPLLGSLTIHEGGTMIGA